MGEFPRVIENGDDHENDRENRNEDQSESPLTVRPGDTSPAGSINA
jgi:hypothetical protein